MFCQEPWGEALNNIMDKESKLIFEKYTNALIIEAWSYNANNGQTALQNQEPDSLIDVGFFKNLLVKAGDPSSIIQGLMWLSRQNMSQWFIDLAKAYYSYYKSGETGNLKLKINETCERSINDAKKALETIISSSTNAKQQGKDASLIGTGLDMNLRKIELNLNNILELQEQYNLINEKELQKQSTGTNVLPTDTTSPSEYFKQFTDFLAEKNITTEKPTNVSEVIKSVTDYINSIFNSTAQDRPVTQNSSEVAVPGAIGNSESNPIQIRWSQFSNNNPTYRKEDFIGKKFKDNRSNIFYEIIDG